MNKSPTPSPCGFNTSPSGGKKSWNILSRACCLQLGVLEIVASLFLIMPNTMLGQGRRPDRNSVPDWNVAFDFRHDTFSFARIRYSSWGGRGRRGGNRWDTDYPDADLNFSHRLQELTSLKVNPDGVILELTDPELFTYPFIYIVEPGRLHFLEPEVENLRRYLLNGGFLMVDDFWGEDEYANFYMEIKRVFPEKEPRELPLEHPIFNLVFPLKEKPQIPSPGWMRYGYERPDAGEVHYRGIFDDEGRMMVIICHNTDLGDGWEEEAYNPEYFQRYSEKFAYPLGINIVFYALTH